MQLDLIQITVLAFIQGLTEFLPISSSAHLILPGTVLGWQDQGLTFDVAVHLGSLAAVLCYFWRDIGNLIRAWLGSIVTRQYDEDARLAWMLILASVPGGVAGFLLVGLVEDAARSLSVIATTTLVFALVLLLCDRLGSAKLKLSDLGWRQALLIGCAQALALIPGTSRSGVTMSAALICNLSRDGAARFSFLLAIPIIVASAGLKIQQAATTGGPQMPWLTLSYAAAVSAIVAFICIHFFIRLVERIGFLPFVAYRIALSLLLFSLLLLR